MVKQNGNLNIPADYAFLEVCIIFGFQLKGGGGIVEVLNFCILNAKYYIHNKRLLDDNNIEFLHFLYIYPISRSRVSQNSDWFCQIYDPVHVYICIWICDFILSQNSIFTVVVNFIQL